MTMCRSDSELTERNIELSTTGSSQKQHYSKEMYIGKQGAFENLT